MTADRTLTATTNLVCILISAWITMIGMGVWHSHSHGMPTIGYVHALLIVLGFEFGAKLIKSWKPTTAATDAAATLSLEER